MNPDVQQIQTGPALPWQQELHRHYCSLHGEYWEHCEDLCANKSIAMICPSCLGRQNH